jgi:hypothetical protein
MAATLEIKVSNVGTVELVSGKIRTPLISIIQDILNNEKTTISTLECLSRSLSTYKSVVDAALRGKRS